jgi:hypothetical protein
MHSVTDSDQGPPADLLHQQRLGVLATDSGAGPYLSLVAFAITPALDRLIFLTKRTTQKFFNITSRPQVAMLIDNRTNQPGDLTQGVAITMLGKATEITGPDKKSRLQFFLDKHPELGAFADEPETAVIEIMITRSVVVSQFEKVQVFDREKK